ncbi:HGL124Wp [Eremothecium sinecaudum]|uniref:HGL124Wp n=1 Tax=Eremothecium sinecaudum TaxID=45286 RepID=A0A120K2Q1_9SACH|nr:HGL124Wp [Eremothecium sinecaudum]AMD22216.1 HGL124Wp [Eremothecium sinecaudum]
MDQRAQTTLQYKLQLLFHINTLLILRSTLLKQGNPQLEGLPAEQIDALLRHYVKRIHCNLQCISNINQGNYKARPAILEPPPLPPGIPQQQDILPKLYILLTKMLEVW